MSLRLPLRKNMLKIYNRWAMSRKSFSSAALGHSYKKKNVLGYSIKQVEEISELNLTALLLEHKATGAEHLHLACDDSNNVFSLAFKTPPVDNTGIPHILEHLTLCGSKTFPCRDPFFNMVNRSLSTFMNAFTGSDLTIYAFSTQNPEDFQNLLSVYLDATFYPSLLEKDFRQEGWRLEHSDVNDKTSPIIFKGVVFNEMKGVFSDQNQYYARHLQNFLFPDNAYSFECGGDPLVIPNLTWENLKHFHSRLYHPSNSRFITYGNMPLETHLEKIEGYVLENFQKIKIENDIADVQPWSNPKEVIIHNRFNPMAAVAENQTTISNSYVLSSITDTYENFALSILGTLLVDGPNAPFYQKLLESGIGPDYSPCTGFDSNLKQSVFSVGLQEIAEKDVEIVKDLITSTFDDVLKSGFPDEQIKGVLHRVEMSTKHKTSKFGLNCALGVSAMWNHNGNPISAFKVNDHVQWFIKQLDRNPHFFQDKIVQYLKDNKQKLTLIMKPCDGFEEEQEKQENELLKSKLKLLSDVEKLDIYQQGLEYEQKTDTSCLPSLEIKDVKPKLEETQLSFTSIGNVFVQLSEQPTNEVVYFKSIVDASSILEEDIMLLPLFTSIITQMGAGDRNYKEFDQEVQLKTGGFTVSLNISEHPSDAMDFKQALLISSYCLEKNVKDMFSLWKDIFCCAHLEDKDRLTQLIKMTAAELAQSITSSGHVYSMRKASSCLSVCAHRREKAFGLTQIAYMKEMAEMKNHDHVLEKLKRLSNALFLQNDPIQCSLNATPSFMPSALKSLDEFLNDIQISQNSTSSSTNEKLLTPPPTNQNTHFVLSIPLNYLGQSISTVPYCHADYSRLKVAAKLLSSKFLHGEIREKGGAYGSGASLSKGGHFMFYSYRDPNVAKTLEAFASGIDWLLEESYSEQDIKEAKLGVFSEVDSPIPPGSKGSQFFTEDISYDMKEATRKGIFDCSRSDITSVVTKYLKTSSQKGTAMIGPENQYTKSDPGQWTIINNQL